MPLLELQGVADDQIRRGLGAVNRFAERGFYEPYSPVPMVPSGSAVWERPTIGGFLLDISAVRFPDTAARLAGSFAPPAEWVAGSVSLSFLLSGTTSSTATITLAAALTPKALGEVLGATVGTNGTAAGPATAGALLEFTSHLVEVTARHALVEWKLAQVAQSYAGQVVIFGARPRWYPRRG